MFHISFLCPVCGENEVGSLPGGTEYYCSSTCDRIALEEASAMAYEDAGEEYKEHFDGLLSAQYDGDADAYLSQWDDDPSPYDGTYSEE